MFRLAMLGLTVSILLGCQLAPLPAASRSSLAPPGRLAYIGGDGNVYITTADRSQTVAVTDDATAAAEYPGLSYHRLSWSPDGRLAFAAVTRSGSDTRSTLYVAETPDTPPQIVGQSDQHFVIYIYWSPTACPDRPLTCRQLAYLIEEEDSISLHLVKLEAGRVDNRRVGAGRPFYFAWSPDGQQMIWHTGGARRHNEQARLVLYDIERDHPEELPQSPGLFAAPAWSPRGDRWLGVSAEAKIDSLQSFGSDQPETLTSAPNGQAVFAWSPDGHQVAYAVRAKPGDPFYGPVHIFDWQTGETRRVTAVGFQILGFFWSPDGQRLAYLTWLPLHDSNWMQWRVFNLAENQDRGYKVFEPSFQMDFMVNSFNQYAQSDRFWSPDSRYLVYADRDPLLVERVWLIDTWAEDGNEALPVAEGAIGLWSWN
jgi:dipeptidyl aminopeptidase/acylaminoacyl peptidase